jgi:hypothetical protein
MFPFQAILTDQLFHSATVRATTAGKVPRTAVALAQQLEKRKAWAPAVACAITAIRPGGLAGKELLRGEAAAFSRAGEENDGDRRWRAWAYGRSIRRRHRAMACGAAPFGPVDLRASAIWIILATATCGGGPPLLARRRIADRVERPDA